MDKHWRMHISTTYQDIPSQIKQTMKLTKGTTVLSIATLDRDQRAIVKNFDAISTVCDVHTANKGAASPELALSNGRTKT